MSAIENLSSPRLIAYNLFKGPAAGIMTDVTSKGIRVRILSRKEFPVKRSDVFLSGPSVADDIEVQIEALRQLEVEVESLKSGMDLELLHAMALEECPEGLSFEDLQALWSESQISFAEKLALARLLADDPCLFKRRKDHFQPNSEEYIASYREQVRRMQEKQAEQARKIGLLTYVGPISEELLQEHEQDLQELVALAGHWRADVLARWQEVFDQSGIRESLDLRRFLIEKQIVDEDTLFEIRECGWPLEYSESFTTTLESLDVPRSAQGMRDCSHLRTFTVDSQSTRDRDDALSYEESTGTFFVHIAHVAGFVKAHPLVEKELEKRLSSLYLPDGGFSMFPPSIAHRKLSLDEGRSVLSMTVALKFENEDLYVDVFEALIRVDANYAYEDVDPADERFFVYFEFAEKIRDWRSSNGAVTFRGRDCDISPGPPIQLRPRVPSPSMNMIAEFAIAANYGFASFCEKQQIPIFFRSQSGDREQVVNHPRYQPVIEDFFQYWQIKRAFGRTAFDTERTAHLSLGLSHYTQMTSPIRRYMDYLNQMQLHRYFASQTLLSREELDQKMLTLSSHLYEVNSVQDKRRKHWLLKWMRQEVEKSAGGLQLYGVALDVFDQDVLIRIEELGTIFKFRRGYAEIKAGQAVKLMVHGVRLLEREPLAEISAV